MDDGGGDAKTLGEEVSEVDAEKLGELQRLEPELILIFQYLEQGILPENEKQAKRLVLERPRFSVMEGVLYYENPDLPGVSRIAVRSDMRRTLLHEAHGSHYAGHFAERKLYTSLRKKYW